MGRGRFGPREARCGRPCSLRFSTRPLLPPVPAESMRGVSGQSAHAQLSLLPTPHSQALGTGSWPRERTGSPKVKGSEQGVTQNEEMRQVGVRPLEVWSHHPRATRESGHPGLGIESPTPTPALLEPPWVRGPQALPWAGRCVDEGVRSPSARVAERMGPPDGGRGHSCPPIGGQLQFPMVRTSFPRRPGQSEASAGSTRGKCGGSPGPVRSFLKPCLPFPPPKLRLEVLLFSSWEEKKPELEPLGVEVCVCVCV